MRSTRRLLNVWSIEELIGRRNRLIERVGEEVGRNNDMVVIMRGADPQLQSNVPLPLKQDSYFR